MTTTTTMNGRNQSRNQSRKDDDMNTNTVCIYDGPSLGDGVRILVLLSGLATPSINSKTGDMIQTYIVRADMAPDIAAKTGEDSSICGGCNFRPVAVKLAAAVGENWVACYVDKIRGPAGAWKSWAAGRVEYVTPAVASARIDKLQRCPGPCRTDCKLDHVHAIHAQLVKGCDCYSCRFTEPTMSAESQAATAEYCRQEWDATIYPKSGHARSACAKTGHACGKLGTRDGAYGDPAKIPMAVWLALHVAGTKRTSYTHAWESSPELASISMASIDNQTWPDVDAALAKAWAMGFRTYRVLANGEAPRDNEIMCPEAGEFSTIQCATCGACNGKPDTKTGRPNNMKSVAIPAIT
jgi:hypothetical protein